MSKPRYSTKKLLKSLKQKYGFTSNYQVHKLLDCAESAVGRWDKGRGTMSNEIGLQVAELLDLDKDEVTLCLDYEREHDPQVKSVRLHLIQRLQPIAAAILVSVFALPPI